MAQIGLLHHVGGCDADLFAISTVFGENLVHQRLPLSHRAILSTKKNKVTCTILMNKKKPPPKAGVSKDQQECVLVSTP